MDSFVKNIKTRYRYELLYYQRCYFTLETKWQDTKQLAIKSNFALKKNGHIDTKAINFEKFQKRIPKNSK